MCLLGLETEFGFSALDRQGERCDDKVLGLMIACVRKRVPNLLCARAGCFVANGGLLYVDTGGHLEWCTPECTSPLEAVRYLRAGEIMVANAARELERKRDLARIQIFKGNVDYTARNVTWGCHESYLYRNFERALPRQLIPFLASRVIFTGAGGLSSSSSGICFRLSPRVEHLVRDVSNSSTDHRGIFHTKNEPLSGYEYNRLHLICGDSNCSQFQSWLKIGTTMLVVAMVDAGLCPGAAVQLSNGVAAMRRFSADAGLRARIDGSEHHDGVSALDIQRQYLAMAERYSGAALMPDWADEICAAWRTTLDALEADPMSLVGKLDWPLKKALFERRMAAHDTVNMDSIEVWNTVLEDVVAAIGSRQRNTVMVNSQLIEENRGRRGDLGAAIRRAGKRLQKHGLHWQQLDEFLKLRWELCELDMAFSDISERGVFNALDQSGTLAHRLFDEEACAAAITEPPVAGRAKIRGEAIKNLFARHGRPGQCNWNSVVADGAALDLHDPFADTSEWQPVHRDPPAEPHDLDLPAFLRARNRGHVEHPS